MAPKKKKPVEKKVVSSTKKAAKASKPTAETPVIKRYKKASNPAVEQAVTELLSHKYSTDETPTVRKILASIKKSQPDQVNSREELIFILYHCTAQSCFDPIPDQKLLRCNNIIM
jgi:hypothetical protein